MMTSSSQPCLLVGTCRTNVVSEDEDHAAATPLNVG